MRYNNKKTQLKRNRNKLKNISKIHCQTQIHTRKFFFGPRTFLFPLTIPLVYGILVLDYNFNFLVFEFERRERNLLKNSEIVKEREGCSSTTF